MPQLFQVLRCYKCLVFQVHQTKKCNKWECKLCGEKQSIKRHYGIGSGKDCRIHVQILNEIRAKKDEVENAIDSDDSTDNTDNENSHKVSFVNITTLDKDNKWSKYVNNSEESVKPVSDEATYLNDVEIVLEIPKKRPQKGSIKQMKRSKSGYVRRHPDTAENNMIYKCEISNELSNHLIFGTKQLNCELKVKKQCMDVVEKMNMVPNKVLSITNVNSKWAQFVSDTESSNIETESVLTNIQNYSHNNLQRIFSLCSDDNDLDNLLDF